MVTQTLLDRTSRRTMILHTSTLSTTGASQSLLSTRRSDSAMKCSRVMFAKTEGHELLPSPLPVGVSAAIGVFVASGGRTGFDQIPEGASRLLEVVGGRLLWRWFEKSMLLLEHNSAKDVVSQVWRNARPFAVMADPACQLALESVGKLAVKLRVAATAARLKKRELPVANLTSLQGVLLEARMWSSEAISEMVQASPLLLLGLWRANGYGLHLLAIGADLRSSIPGSIDWVDSEREIPVW